MSTNRKNVCNLNADVLKIILSFMTQQDIDKLMLKIPENCTRIFKWCQLVLNINKEADFIKIRRFPFARFRFNESMGRKCIDGDRKNIAIHRSITVLNKKYPIRRMFELKKVYEFKIGGCEIQDLSILSGVKILSFRTCDIYADVSPLRNSHSVSITDCTIPFDLGKLNGIYRLNLINCKGFVNMELIGDVRVLNVSGCQNLINYDKIKSTRFLDVSLTNVINASFFHNVRSLNISNTRVHDVSMLGNIYDLNLSDCKNVTDFSALGGNHVLNLSGTCIVNVSMLGNVHKINLSHTNVSDVSMLGNAHELDLSHTKVLDISALCDVRVLKLFGLKRLKHANR